MFSAEELKKMAFAGKRGEKENAEEYLFRLAARGIYDRKEKAEMREAENAYQILCMERMAEGKTLRSEGDKLRRTEGLRTVIRIRAMEERKTGEEEKAAWWRKMAMELCDALDGIPGSTAMSPQVTEMKENEKRKLHGEASF